MQNSTAGVPAHPIRPLVITERGSAALHLPPPPDRKWTAAEVDALTMKVQHLASGVPPPATVPEVETPGVGGDTGPAPGPCKRPRATHFGAASFIAGDISSELIHSQSERKKLRSLRSLSSAPTRGASGV